MGLFANRMDLSGLLFIGKQMLLGMFLSLAGKKSWGEKMRFLPHSAYVAGWEDEFVLS